jgi:raffinose/stachyose/melibiose transport system substrate-binding protein
MKLMKKTVLTLVCGLAAISFGFANGSQQGGGKAGASSGPIELRWSSIWVGQDSKAPSVQQLVDAFNTANQGKIKVVIDPQPDYNAYEQKVRTSIAGGQAPADIFTIKLNPTTEEFYQSPLLMDFAKVMDAGWKADFQAGPLAQSTINGELKSLPMETGMFPLWYNMDLMKKAGVSTIPTTMDEMWADFDKLKAAGIYPTSQMTGDTNAWTSMLWYSMFAVSLGGVNVWQKPFTDPAFVQAAELIKRLIKDYSTPDAVGLGAGDSGGHFLAQRTAVFTNGPWYAGRKDLKATSFFPHIQLALCPPAGNTKNVLVSRLQANICAAATKDPNRQAAILKFLKYLTTPANIAKIEAGSGAMFAINTDYKPTNNELFKQFYDLGAKYTTTATDLEAALGAEATLEFEQQLSALVLGKIDAKTFCQLVNAKKP